MHTRSTGFASIFLAGLLSLFLGTTSAQGTTYTWASANTGAGPFNWDNASSQDNWATTPSGGFPNAAADVASVIRNITANQTINLNQAITLGSLTIGDLTASGTYNQYTVEANGGSLIFDNGASPAVLARGGGTGSSSNSNIVNINAPITVASDRTLRIYITGAGTLNVNSAMTGSSTAVIESFASDTSARPVRLTGDISGFDGTYKINQVTGADSFQFFGTTAESFDGSGAKFELSGSTTTSASNTRIVKVSGSTFKMGELSGSGGYLQDDLNSLTPDQTMTLEVGHLNTNSTWNGVFVNQTVDLGTTANFTKVGTGTLTLGGSNAYKGVTTVSAGKLLVNGSPTGNGAYNVASSATLGGIGNLGTSAVNIASGGALAPGGVATDPADDRIGTFTVGSADIDGTLRIQFGNNQIDKLFSVGDLDFTNTVIDFSALGSLSNGDYVFAEYFGTLTLSGPLPAYTNLPASLALIHQGNQFLLRGAYDGVLPGDFNGDNKVDAADYVLWRKNPAAFDNGNPGSGYDLWRAHFGNPAGSGSSLDGAGSVPEPAPLTLLLCTTVGLLLSGRRPHKNVE